LVHALKDAACRIDPEALVIAGDLNPEAHARYVADDFWAMPSTEDSNLEVLIDACTERGIQVILPTRDGELLFWSRNRSRFSEAGLAVIVSPPKGILCCLDKLKFAEWGLSHGLPVIPAADTPDPFGDGPFVVKERFGASSLCLGLNLDEMDARAHAASLSDPIFQPFVYGSEISIDAWLTASGEVHGLVLRRRDHVVGGESQVTTTFRDPEIEEQAAAVLGGLGLSGPVVMQAILTDAGLAVIEVNPRFGGASTSSIAVGLDLLFWSLHEGLALDDPVPPFARRSGEVRQVRVPQDIVVHDPDF